MTKDQRKNSAEHRIAKAFSHPLRVQILGVLNERVASPNRLSKDLDESLNLIAYHVRVLEKYGCVELVETKPRRGATEHFYRATKNKLLNDTEWARLAKQHDRHLSRTTMKLDERGWGEVTTLLDTSLEQMAKIEAQATRRLAAEGEPGIAARVEILQTKPSEPA